MKYHEPVLIDQCINGLGIKSDGKYVDVTYGGGGHSKDILKRLTTGKLFAFDQDEYALVNEIMDSRFVMINNNFRYLKRYLKYYEAIPVDGILADLGVSSHQIDVPERGFSIRYEAELDMRMDINLKITAKDIINTYSEQELKRIFTEYGEISNAGKLARIIVICRTKRQIKTVNDLKEVVKSCVLKGKENQYYSQLFQALRIEVNDELGALKELLIQSKDVLTKGGRLVVISYHSLEDRLVKNFINKGKFEGEVDKDLYGNSINVPFKVINKRPIIPSEDEIRRNPRSRSAKLRIAERI